MKEADLLKVLKEDHHRLLDQAEELRDILVKLREPLSPGAVTSLRENLQRLLTLLQSHGEKEQAELFTALERRMDEGSRWQVRMIEVQDEMLLNEVRHLHGLATDTSSPASVERLKEGGKHLIRWMREHIMVEEDHLFPRLQGRSEGPKSTLPGPTSLRKVSLWSRLKALFKRSTGI